MRVITTTEELEALCAACARAPYVTVDTEFMRERTYWSQLCLVQVAAPAVGDEPEQAAIIDPLAPGIALDALYALMGNTAVVKAFHAARQDVEIFWHLGNVIPTPMFDTQVAAMVLGYGEQVGYETLVRKIAKAELDKSSRFTDWSRRPLSGQQLEYALGDVTHLRDIYAVMSKRLAKSGRAQWVAEEMAILTDPATYETHPDDAWKRVKARTGNQTFLAIVAALARWREAEAQARDVPRQRLLKDDALLEVATARPRDAESLGKLRLLQREARRPDFAAAIIAAVEAGINCPPDRRPHVPPPPKRREGSAALADLLRVFLKARADQLGIAAKLLASTSDLDALAGEDDPDLALLRGWRREVFGEDALRLIAGEVGLAARKGGIELIELDRIEAS